jgi:hypothetical protein
MRGAYASRFSICYGELPVKKWWQSKTVIVNVLTATVAVLTTLVDQQIIAENPQAVALTIAAISGVNVALRFITVLPIGG